MTVFIFIDALFLTKLWRYISMLKQFLLEKGQQMMYISTSNVGDMDWKWSLHVAPNELLVLFYYILYFNCASYPFCCS